MSKLGSCLRGDPANLARTTTESAANLSIGDGFAENGGAEREDVSFEFRELAVMPLDALSGQTCGRNENVGFGEWNLFG